MWRAAACNAPWGPRQLPLCVPSAPSSSTSTLLVPSAHFAPLLPSKRSHRGPFHAPAMRLTPVPCPPSIPGGPPTSTHRHAGASGSRTSGCGSPSRTSGSGSRTWGCAHRSMSSHQGAASPCGDTASGDGDTESPAAPGTARRVPLSPGGTHTVVRRWRSTEMVWQVECSSTRAVDSVASFTTPM